MRQPPVNKLANKVLRLIRKDLRRIEAFKVEDKDGRKIDPPPGVFALTLSRYFAALMQHKRLTEKVEDEWRAKARKMTTKELREAAGVEGPKK